MPEYTMLRELRRELSYGGLPTRRTPEDYARITSFRVIEELLCLLDAYRRRLDVGEPCHLVEIEHAPEKGRLLSEFVIKVAPRPMPSTSSGSARTPTSPSARTLARVAEPRASRFQMPAYSLLRELHDALGDGGARANAHRAPTDRARLACYRVIGDLLRLLDDFRRSVERGERCRLVESEHPREDGRLLLEFVIKVFR
jgi:hypothetical protein